VSSPPTTHPIAPAPKTPILMPVDSSVWNTESTW
jgi:hypothetical protein